MLSINDLTIIIKIILATFRELLPPKSGELRANEIFFGKYSFVPIKINTFALNSID